MGDLATGWQRIAWRWNDRKGGWSECKGAVMSYDLAHALIMEPWRDEAARHLFAHRIEGEKTFLVWKLARGARQ
jgi:hypothetical protein